MMLAFAIAFAIGLMVLPVIWLGMCAISVDVEESTAVIITRFGAVHKILRSPGHHWLPQKLLPWVKPVAVSLQRDFRQYSDISVNDCRGTTVIIDLWIELRIADPVKALFQVEDWEQALQSLLTNATTALIGARTFDQILSNRTELGQHLREDVRHETQRWGLAIDMVYISKLSLLPDVARQIDAAACARLEQAKADVEEDGRLRIAMLEAETNAHIASLLAEANAQEPLAVSRAYRRLAQESEVLAAYKEVYELSLARPNRTVLLRGFEPTAIDPLDLILQSPARVEGASLARANARELKNSF